MFGNLLAFGAVSGGVWLLGVLFIALCVFLIAVVLLQKGRGEGLSSALGGAGGQSAFGSKTGDKLTVFTVGVVVFFFLGAILLSVCFTPEKDPSEQQQPPVAAPVAPAKTDDAKTDENTTKTYDNKDAATPATTEPKPADQ